ncbi:MAG: potassium channel protein [Thermodesulfobacteriota bacterium]|nr:potassium channel protein [Thermodesulfobacteriota bacterium]
MSLRKRFHLLVMTILVVVVAGSVGYYLLFGGQYPFIDCLYMTVISLTSVGYGEVIAVSGNLSAQIFTMILITGGLGIILYGISSLAALLVEGELTGFLKETKMKNKIKKLRHHYIVCGGGKTGFPLIQELVKNGEQVVLIEENEERLERCAAIPSVYYLKGDATDDAMLVDAGIEHARGILITMESDKDGLYVTMSARMLNRNIRIISRVTHPRLELKLRRAGADGVVSPNAIGALRMASEMIRPVAVDFLDSMIRTGDACLRIHEVPIHEGSRINGKSIRESNLKERFNIMVLGVRRADRELQFNPSPDVVLEDGMTLVVMGEVEKIREARQRVNRGRG